MFTIYRMTEEAWNAMMDWETALNNGMIKDVEEFETIEEAEEAFKAYDPDRYGIDQR